MWMFDEITCEYPLPGTPPEFVKESGFLFQTKDLDCTLGHYIITKTGELIDSDPAFDNLGVEIEPNIIKDYFGCIEFYTSNIHGGGPTKEGYKQFTKNGEDAESVRYKAIFSYGKLVEIIEGKRTKVPALPIKDMKIT